MQRRLHVQENTQDTHEVWLRQGAQIQVSLLQQKGQMLLEYLQTR